VEYCGLLVAILRSDVLFVDFTDGSSTWLLQTYYVKLSLQQSMKLAEFMFMQWARMTTVKSSILLCGNLHLHLLVLLLISV